MLRTPIGQTRAPLIAADGSTSALLDAGILPDIIVTDLDGDVPRIIDASKQGSIVFLHAHGDNTAPVAFHLELLQNVVPITQTEPTEIVRNFGGFTDGDKCVFLANAFGVSRMLLVGMEFGQVVGSWSGPKERKRSSQRKFLKLRIGRRLVENQVERSGTPTYCLGVPAIKGVEELREDQILSFMGRDDWRS
jgi:uncharacterized Rossmann fold enzyme